MDNEKLNDRTIEEPCRDIFFISDAHIGSRDKDAEIIKQQNLSQFINYFATVFPPPILYIVGDLFDFWFEYKYTVPAEYQKLLSRLVYLTEIGVTIRYVTGNHDFWMKNFFPNHLNIEINHGTHSFHSNSKSFCLFHGDGVLDEDKGYKILKKILQNPITIKMYQWIHPDIGIPIAKWASSMSRNHYARDPERQIKDDNEYFEYAKEQLKNSHDFMLMGHSHRPMNITNGKKTYINLGDWIRNFTFAKFSNNKLKLFRWVGIKSKGKNEPFVEIRPEFRIF